MGVTKDCEDEIVITGMSGRYPESDDLDELWSNLLNKVDMIKVDDRRWPVGVFEVDTFGKLKDISRFDAPFFNFSPEEATQCAPDVRVMLEVAWETLTDAGVNPAELENTQTGVYIGNCIIEAGEALTNNVKTQTATGLLNSMHSSLPNKVSEYFKLRGPSETHDTGCSASLIALDTAVMAMKRGDITAALVGGCSLNLKPQATVALHRMNMVSRTRGCKVYDKSADGYTRAECISLVFLQWKTQARRVYGRIVNTVTNNDGFKEQGIIFPSSTSQVSLLREAYEGTCVNVSDVQYIEAHGTGTQAGDTQECLAVDTFFCENRTTPILIGSIKSNLGHAEPASGVASLCKVLLSYVHKTIPPNIHLTEVNPKLDAVIQGRLKIVTEPMPLVGDALVSLNAFGFGGSNAHAVLLPNEYDDGSEQGQMYCVGGRTEAGVASVLEVAEAQPTRGLQDLLSGLSTISHDLYPARGCLLLSQGGDVVEKLVGSIPTSPSQVWLLLGGLGSQWVGMGRDMMRFPSFRGSIDTCQNIVTKLGADINIAYLLCDDDSDIESNIVSMFVGISALVIALTDMLRVAGVKVDGVIGHSLGDTLCGYPLGIHSVDDIMKSAYVRSTMFLQYPDLAGVMYSINTSASLVTLPGDMCIACYNAPHHITTSSTLPHTDYTASLIQSGLRVKQVASGGFAFHSPRFSRIKEQVMEAMSYIGSLPMPDNWISTSYPVDKRPDHITPSLYSDNLVNPVYFSENVGRLPPNSTIIEVSGNSSLLGLLPPHHTRVGLMRYRQNCEDTFLVALGRLYVGGIAKQPYNLLPLPTFPVPRSTPVLSPSTSRGWNHTTKWWVPTIADFLISSNEAKMNKFVSTFEIGQTPATSTLDIFLEKYSVLGRRIVPLSAGVYLAWVSFAHLSDVTHSNLSVQIAQAVIHNKIDLDCIKLPASVCVGIMPKSGQFQITVGDVFFMSGVIETYDQLLECSPEWSSISDVEMSAAELMEFYQLQSASNKLISKLHLQDYSCTIAPSEDLLEILDCHFQVVQLERLSKVPLVYITGAASITLDARRFFDVGWISKPYPGSSKSDAVFVDNVQFEVLEPRIMNMPAYQNGDFSEKSFDKGEYEAYKSVLYCNLLGSSVECGKERMVVTSIVEATQLHVIYATNVAKSLFAVGLLNTEEVLENSNISSSLVPVSRDVYSITPEYWECLAVAMCVVILVEQCNPTSVLVLGDGDMLYKTLQEILGTATFMNVKESTPKDLFSSPAADCTVNITSSKHAVDTLALTKRCGKTINLVQSLPDDCGMAALLRNISVVNFKASHVKCRSYWGILQEKLAHWADNCNVVGDSGHVALPGTLYSEQTHITLYSPSHCIDSVLADYFRYKAHYNMTTHRHTDTQTIRLVVEGRQDEAEVSYNTLFNPVQLRLCLHNISSNIEGSTRTYVIKRSAECTM